LAELPQFIIVESLEGAISDKGQKVV